MNLEDVREVAVRLVEALELERTLAILYSLFPADESYVAWQDASAGAERLAREYADALVRSKRPVQAGAGRIRAPKFR